LSGPENRSLQDGWFSWDYTTQISVFDWGDTVGGKLDFIDKTMSFRLRPKSVFNNRCLIGWFAPNNRRLSRYEEEESDT